VLLTDILIKGGMNVPTLAGPKADMLLSKLHPGSSVANPIDFLATGTAKQLGEILDHVEAEWDEIDGSVVVFGTTGMWRVDDAYGVLHEKIKMSSKPIFPILPSTIQAAEEVSHFLSMGHVNFMDEVSFGYTLSRVAKMQTSFADPELPEVDCKKIREIVNMAGKGYLPADKVFELMDAAGIARVQQVTVATKEEAVAAAHTLGYPLVMKVSGPVHKSDIGGVVLNIQSGEEVQRVFKKLIAMEGADGVLLQQQLSGVEVYLGAKAEDKFGHQVLCGLGGIFVEVFKDVSSGLVPIGRAEAHSMIRHLKSYPIIKGVRGKEGVNEALLAEAITKLSALLQVAPEISELDINPLLGNAQSLVAVDARICIGGR
jgi:acetate---CoA ligase (ADP-forming)